MSADLEEVLGVIATDLKTLNEREEKGEEVADEKAKLEAEQKRVEEQLAAEKEEPEPKDDSTRMVEAVTKAVLAAVTEQKAEVSEEDKITRAATEAVKAAMSEHPGTSRFLGQNADPGVVERVAEGGSYSLVEQNKPVEIKLGVNREVKGLQESKSVAQLMCSMVRNLKGMATPAEHEWITGLSQKALAEGTASAGGVLVPEEWMPDILGLLRAQAVVRRANPRVVPFNKLMNQTSISTGATAYYTAENAAISPSEETFAEAPLLTPKNLTALVPVSDYLLADAAQAEQIVREDMAQVIALREDLAFLTGDGTGGSPIGFLNIVGKTLDPVLSQATGNGFSMTLPQWRQFRATFRTFNAGAIRPVAFFHPSFLTKVEGLVDADGRFLTDAGLLRINEDMISGTLDGIPFFTTTQLPANQTQGTSTNATSLYIVNMAEVVLGMNMELQLDVSSEASYTPNGGTTWISAFQNNQTLFRARLRHDINHRRPPQILVQRGVLV